MLPVSYNAARHAHRAHHAWGCGYLALVCSVQYFKEKTMKKTLTAAALAGLMGLMPTAHASGELAKLENVCAALNEGKSAKLHVYTVDEMVRLLEKHGFNASKKDANAIRFMYENSLILMVRYNDGDWQLYYGTSGVKLTYEQINDWNRTKRISRAYIDRDGDPVVESDLLVGKGVTEDQVMNFIKVFLDFTRPQFKNFVKEKGKSS
ncbi:YbjN domain-containing protein [Hydrogenophilus thiooxidans]|uniref:YbjN domain-containing protein n=1 Tax=Hydrogenophilus thiooxidans TaxID=2820326 RepID=UPI003D2C8BAD